LRSARNSRHFFGRCLCVSACIRTFVGSPVRPDWHCQGSNLLNIIIKYCPNWIVNLNIDAEKYLLYHKKAWSQCDLRSTTGLIEIVFVLTLNSSSIDGLTKTGAEQQIKHNFLTNAYQSKRKYCTTRSVLMPMKRWPFSNIYLVL